MDSSCHCWCGEHLMPTELWFEAVTPEGYTAWSDLMDESLSLDPIILDMRTGAKSFRVEEGGGAAANVLVEIEDTSIARAADVLTDGDGWIRLFPVSTGNTTIKVGPSATHKAVTTSISVVDTSDSSMLVVMPQSPINLDLMTGGIFLDLTSRGRPVQGVTAEVDRDGVVSLIDLESDYRGRIRIEPDAIGSAQITLRLNEGNEYPLCINGRPLTAHGEILTMTGENQTVTMTVNVTSTEPESDPTTIRLASWTPMDTLRVCDGPVSIHIVDQVFRHLPMSNRSHRVDADVDLPGCLTTASSSLGGRFRLVPVSAGEGKIRFTYRGGGKKLYLERRFKVLP